MALMERKTAKMAMAGRKDWVQADLRCLMCGRVIGRLVGPLPAPDAAPRAAGWKPQFAAFRPADRNVPAVRLEGREQFRCSVCGGGVLMDALETFSTYDDIVDDDAGERPKRGRPPKPWRRPPAESSWLDELGIAG